MELENFSENVKELDERQSGKASGNGESLKPEFHVPPMELARRNLSFVVISVLLGVCILLSVMAIVTTVLLITGNHKKTLSAFDTIQDEISQLNKTTKNFEKSLSSIAKIPDEISQLSKNTKTSIACVKNELSQWKRNVAANFREMEDIITKLQSDDSDTLQWSGSSLPSPTEWIRFNESCYHFSATTKTWVEAQRACASVDAHLVVINNAEEQEFLRCNLVNRYWIGLSDTESEGDWRWVDGTNYSSSFTNWSEGEPNDERCAEDCAETFASGKWNDLPCGERQRWICERSVLIASSI